jgi:hypothetical protein
MPGEKPVIEFVGAEPRLPMIVVAPELVTPAPPNTAKLSAVVPNRGVAEAAKEEMVINISPRVDMLRWVDFISLSPSI